MALRQSKQILAGYPVPNAINAVAAVPVTAEYVIPAAGLGLNDVIEMGGIAEGMIAIGCTVVCEKLDANGSPAIMLQAGFVSGVYGAKDNSRTCGAEFLAASNVGQAGGVAHSNAGAGLLMTPISDITPFGVKVTAAPATNIVGARIRMTVTARPAPVSI